MSNFRRQAADALADAIHGALGSALREKPTVVAANPSEVADYPRVAVSMERFPLFLYSEDELMVDEDGEPLLGARSRLLDLPAGPAKIDSTNRLSKVGTFRGFGRVWVGCRYPSKREEMEYAITQVFTQDSSAIGRLLVCIPHPRLGQLELPWRWNAAFFVKESSWTDEHAFEERLWSWTNFDVEMDFLVARSSPMIEQVMLGINAYLAAPGQVENFQVSDDGVFPA